MRGRAGNSRGFALMVTMWVMVMLTVIALSFSVQTRQGSVSTSNFKEEIIARTAALSAYEEAVAYLLGDKDPSIDYLDGEGNFHTDRDRPTVTGTKTINNTEVEILITDEESRLNLNFMNPNLMRDLLRYTGIPDEEVQPMIDSLADWVDPDDLLHLNGAEEDYYGTMGYKPKNMPIELPEELLLVKGFKPEYLYGNEDFAAVYPLVTTRGRGININTASKEVLEVLGFSQPEIDSVVIDRENGGIRVPHARLEGFGLTASQNFRVEVTASLRQSTQKIKITTILYRPPDGSGLRNVYYKEQIENGRA